MSSCDPLLEELLAQPPRTNDLRLLEDLLGVPAFPVAPSLAAALAQRPAPARVRRPPSRLLGSAAALLIAGALAFGAAPAYAEETQTEPAQAPAAAQVAFVSTGVADVTVNTAAGLPAAAPSSAAAALPPLVPSALVQPLPAQAAPSAASPSAAQAAPGSGNIADAAPGRSQAAPAAQPAPGSIPAAQAAFQPKQQLPSAVRQPAAPSYPARPTQPRPVQRVVTERVIREVVYIVIPPPDLSDPFVHLRGTQFDPAFLAQGGARPAQPTRTTTRTTRVVTRVVSRPATPRAGSYVVRAGDTLTDIALRCYGNAELWPRIYNANRAVIGSNPNVLPAGVRLAIP